MNHRRWLLGLVLIGGLLAHGDAMAAEPPDSGPGSASQAGFRQFATHLQEAREANHTGDPSGEQESLLRAKQALDSLAPEPANAAMKQDFSSLFQKGTFGRLHGDTGPFSQDLYLGLENGSQGGLSAHLREALVSHEQRRPYYAAQTQGRSEPLFRKIGMLQRLNLPVGWYIDLRARKFQKAGIPIITGDLVSMSGILPRETPPRHRKIMTAAAAEEVRLLLRDFQKQAFRLIPKKAFLELAGATYNLVQRVRQVETRDDVHLAMTLHLLESVGIAALHSVTYLKQSQGATAGISQLYLSIQIFPLQECLKTDQKAQALHAIGVGVIVNDVPPIPFVTEWESGADGKVR